MERRLQPHGRFGDRTGLQEFDGLEVRRRPAQRLQDQLEVAGRRHDRRVVHPVVGQPGEVLVRQPAFEARMLRGNPVSHQRTLGVLALPDEHLVVGHDVHRRLLLARVPGEQVADGFGPRILGLEVELDADPEQRSQRPLEVETDVAVPHQAGKARRLPERAFQALRDGRLERGVRGDFEQRVGAELALHGLHRRPEPHRLADVRPPVGAVQLRRDLPGDRGDERRVGIRPARIQERQGRERAVPDPVHGGGVERDVPGQQHVLQPAAVELRHHRPQGGFLAADDGVGGRVLAGDLDRCRFATAVFAEPEGNPQGVEHLLDARPVEADDQHPPRPGGRLLLGGPVVHEPGRFRERQDPGRVGGGDLAGAVPHHRVRIDAPGLEQLDERALDHEDDGLGQTDLVERLLRGGEGGFPEREVRVLPPVRLDAVHGAPEDGVGVVELAAATRPLRALAGEHHRQPPIAFLRRGHGCRVAGERIQRRNQILAGLGRKGGADGEMSAAPAEIPRQCVEGDVALAQRVRERFRAPDQRPGGAG